MNRLVRSLRDDAPETRWRVVLLVMRDKNIAGICEELRRLPVQELHALRSADPRACEPERLLSAAVEAGVVSADRCAILDNLASMPAGVHEGLLVTGSYRHLSEARRCFASDAVE
jgi:folylpolyglutamate synthase/dihydropteroate synthase